MKLNEVASIDSGWLVIYETTLSVLQWVHVFRDAGDAEEAKDTLMASSEMYSRLRWHIKKYVTLNNFHVVVVTLDAQELPDNIFLYAITRKQAELLIPKYRSRIPAYISLDSLDTYEVEQSDYTTDLSELATIVEAEHRDTD